MGQTTRGSADEIERTEKNVLLADDCSDDRSLCEVLLRQSESPVAVHAPRHPVELGEMIGGKSFDAAIIEANLGWIESAELARKIRNASPGCHIIFYSRQPLESLSPEMAKLGLTAYLLKTSSQLILLPELLSDSLRHSEELAATRETTPRTEPSFRQAPPDSPADKSIDIDDAMLEELPVKLVQEISHDLTQPIQLLSRQLDMLKENYRDDLPKPGRKLVDNMIQVAGNMQLLLDAALNVNGSGYEKQLDDKEDEADVGDTINAVIAAHEPTLTKISAQVTVGKLPKMMVAKAPLTRLMNNLLANAIKFRSEDTLHVHIELQEVADNWLFSVTDNGIGIDSEHLENIFTPFYKLHSNQDYPGQGLGLGICKKIVETAGGKIWARSKPGEGTTINFTLPKTSINTLRVAN